MTTSSKWLSSASPNAGKSSLINRILGEERVIVSNMAGTTRDAVDSYFENDKGKYLFIDTAGMRKKSKVVDRVEKFSVLRATMAIERGRRLPHYDRRPTTASPNRTPRWPAWPTRRARPASSWSTSGTPVEKDGKTMDKMRDEARPGGSGPI